MKYNPNIHHRRSIRLKGYDYSQAGLYFVTICVQDRQCLFGKITDSEMVLNDFGKIASQCWIEIPQHFPHAVLHEYIIMPNHVHGIIELETHVGAKNFSPEQIPQITPEQIPPSSEQGAIVVGAKNFLPLQPITNNKPFGTSRTIGSIVRGFKIGVTKQLGYSVWQRNYYEIIIRNKKSYQRIVNYIINNPANWGKDDFFTE